MIGWQVSVTAGQVRSSRAPLLSLRPPGRGLAWLLPAGLVTAGDCPFPRDLAHLAPLAGPDELAGLDAALPGYRGQLGAERLGRGAGPLRGPVSSEAMAAITLAAIANANATPRPSWNGAVIRCGKNWRPVT